MTMPRKVKPLKGRTLFAYGEPLKRYRQAKVLMRRLLKSINRQGWEDGENESEATEAVLKWLDHQKLEIDHFGEPDDDTEKQSVQEAVYEVFADLGTTAKVTHSDGTQEPLREFLNRGCDKIVSLLTT